MESDRIFVANCIDNLLKLLPEYAAKTLAQRCPGPQACGSVWDQPHTWEELKSLDWTENSRPPLNSIPGCRYFYTLNLGGTLGVIWLPHLPTSTIVTLDDRKNTGKISAVIKRTEIELTTCSLAHTNFTTLITGEENGMQVVFTVHPGDPVRPSQVVTEPGLHGKNITVAEALEMGLTIAKLDWSDYDWSQDS